MLSKNDFHNNEHDPNENFYNNVFTLDTEYLTPDNLNETLSHFQNYRPPYSKYK